MLKKIFKWIIAILIVGYFSGLAAQIAFGATSKDDVNLGYIIWGIKTFDDKLVKEKNINIKFRATDFKVPVNVITGRKIRVDRCYKAIEIYNLPGDNNWFYEQGLRQGDFIMSFSIYHGPGTLGFQSFKCYNIDNDQMNNLLLGSFRDILKRGYTMRMHVFRILEWADKDKLKPAKAKLIPFKLKIKKGK